MNDNAMHSCGHDAHAVIGLALAELLMDKKDSLAGMIKLIFQPAEEGVRGGKAVAAKGFLDDVDFFLGAHVGMGVPTGSVSPACGDFLCTTKFDLTYKGKAAHAGGAPNEGRNALLAAASATLALAGIPPHKDGATRINVGVLQAGSGRNVVPSRAVMKVETRGLTMDLNSYVYDRAMEIVSGAASMYGVEMSMAKMGEAVDALSDQELAGMVGEKALTIGGIDRIAPSVSLGGSEDVSWMMRAVQKRGGKAVYFVLGTDIAAGHHNEYFDIDEKVLDYGPALFAELAFYWRPKMRAEGGGERSTENNGSWGKLNCSIIFKGGIFMAETATPQKRTLFEKFIKGIEIVGNMLLTPLAFRLSFGYRPRTVLLSFRGRRLRDLHGGEAGEARRKRPLRF